MSRLYQSIGLGCAMASCLLAATSTGKAQSIGERVAEVRDGKVRMSYAAHPGVRCNDSTWRGRKSDDWESWCEDGPVRLVLELSRGEVADIDVYVGGRWRTASKTTVDLGMVSAPQAVEYLLELARRAPTRVGKQAIYGSVLADSAVVWPDLLRLARERSRPEELRKAAVFWVGQAAGAAATAGLDSLTRDDSVDREVKETAVFALSQRPPDEGVPALIRIVRTHPDPAIRKRAVFWLGQSDDPRALQLFEELLAGS